MELEVIGDGLFGKYDNIEKHLPIIPYNST